MQKLKNRCLGPVLLGLSLIFVCGSANAADYIVEVADKAGMFKTLLAAARAAGLAHTLQEDGPFTVFKPDSSEPELAWEYDAKGNCERIHLGSTAVMKPILREREEISKQVNFRK